MQTAENSARKRHGSKKGGGTEKFVNSERLRVLGKYLKEDIKRFRDPGKVTNAANLDDKKDVEQTLGEGFFKLKTK